MHVEGLRLFDLTCRGDRAEAEQGDVAQRLLFNGERHQRQIHCALGSEKKNRKSCVCRDIRRQPRQRPRSIAAIMAHIVLAEDAGEPRPLLRDGSGYLDIQHTAGSITLSSQRDGRSNER
jgi:hypothetical protein